MRLKGKVALVTGASRASFHGGRVVRRRARWSMPAVQATVWHLSGWRDGVELDVVEGRALETSVADIVAATGGWMFS